MSRPAPLPPLQIEPRPFPTALARELWALEKSHRTRCTPHTTGAHDHETL